MGNQKCEITIDWEEVILRLQSFTRSLVNKLKWFRGIGTKNFIEGKEIDDFVFEAITRYLESPEKYDSTKGSLIKYLQYNLIRTLVGNDLKSAENRTTKDVYSIAEHKINEDEDLNTYLDSILPYMDALFDQEIDYNNIMSSLEDSVKGDKIVEEIFLGICCFGLKRREIIKEFDMSEIDYDNGMRRYKTILNSTKNKYDLKNQLA